MVSKILIVDDDIMFRKMTAKILNGWGYRVYEATDGREAILLCEELHPQVVLLDAILPGIDGFETCQRIKHFCQESLQVIMVTGDEGTAAVSRAFAVGAVDFIPKPIHYTVLEHRLKRLIENQQAQEALKASEAKFRTLFSSVADAVLVVAVDEGEQTGQILEANEQACRLLGYTKEELLHLQEEHIVHEFFGQNVIENRQDSIVKELVLATKSGTNILVEVHQKIINFENHRVLLAVFRDLTERRRAEDDLRENIFLASRVQRSFLPPACSEAKFSIETIYHPYDVVGGDLYNYRYFPEQEKLAGYLVDVTGHNVATAMRASALSAMLWEVAARTSSLEEKMAWVNHEVGHFFSEDTFAAVIYFELDLRQKQLNYVSCGVNYFYTYSESRPKRVKTPGLYMGILEQTDFESHTVPVETGDAFYFMSDGLYELLEDVSLNWQDFQSSIADLKKFAKSSDCLDDASALCIRIEGD